MYTFIRRKKISMESSVGMIIPSSRRKTISILNGLKLDRVGRIQEGRTWKIKREKGRIKTRKDGKSNGKQSLISLIFKEKITREINSNHNSLKK